MEQQISDDSIKHVNTNKLFVTGSFILAIAGLLISAYLFYQHYLLINEANSKADVCYAVFGKGCTRALSSSVAVQLGLPLAGWGIIYYAVIAFLLSAFFKNKNTRILISLFAITLLGCISSILLLVMIYFDHALFCPFCVIIHGINILLFFSIIKISSHFFVSASGKQFDSILKFRSANKNNNTNIKWKHSMAFILLVIFLYSILYLLLIPHKIIFDDKKFVKEFDNTPQQKIIVDADDHILGSVNLPVQLIVFSDFECAACRNFSKVITQLQKKYRDKFYVVFKNFPLGKECNPIYGNYDLHPKACEAARAAEAAGLQQKFWQYHDLLFSLNLEKTKETFLSLAAKTGLNLEQFEKDRKGEIVMSRVAKTIEQGKQLGVKGTPAVFLNGRFVSDFRSLHMQVLLDHLLNPGLSFLRRKNL